MDQYLGIIIQWGGTFTPSGYQPCSGQLLSIAQNAALFSLLGTSYGGNGQTTFGLPDLRGRTPIGQGSGPGLTPYSVGQMTGTETVTLLSGNIPSHSHNVNAFAGAGDQTTPSNTVLGEGPKSGSGVHLVSSDFYINAAPNTALNPQSVSTNLGGSSVPMHILQPFTTVYYLIATTGVFPTRN